MSYWGEVKGVVLKGIDLALAGAKQGAVKAVEKSKEGVAFAQLKTSLFMEQRKLHNLLADLGDVVRDIYLKKSDLYGDSAVAELMRDIGIVEEECARLEREIKTIGADAKIQKAS